MNFEMERYVVFIFFTIFSVIHFFADKNFLDTFYSMKFYEKKDFYFYNTNEKDVIKNTKFVNKIFSLSLFQGILNIIRTTFSFMFIIIFFKNINILLVLITFIQSVYFLTLSFSIKEIRKKIKTNIDKDININKKIVNSFKIIQKISKPIIITDLIINIIFAYSFLVIS